MIIGQVNANNAANLRRAYNVLWKNSRPIPENEKLNNYRVITTRLTRHYICYY